MAEWAIEFAQEVVNSEAKTKDTWSDLSQQLRAAVAAINKALEGKSQTKLALTEAGDLISEGVSQSRSSCANHLRSRGSHRLQLQPHTGSSEARQYQQSASARREGIRSCRRDQPCPVRNQGSC
jgi:hypothetical protein